MSLNKNSLLAIFLLVALAIAFVSADDFDGQRYRRQFGGFGRGGYGRGGYGGGYGRYGGGGYGGGFGGFGGGYGGGYGGYGK